MLVKNEKKRKKREPPKNQGSANHVISPKLFKLSGIPPSSVCYAQSIYPWEELKDVPYPKVPIPRKWYVSRRYERKEEYFRDLHIDIRLTVERICQAGRKIPLEFYRKGHFNRNWFRAEPPSHPFQRPIGKIELGWVGRCKLEKLVWSYGHKKKRIMWNVTRLPTKITPTKSIYRYTTMDYWEEFINESAIHFPNGISSNACLAERMVQLAPGCIGRTTAILRMVDLIDDNKSDEEIVDL